MKKMELWGSLVEVDEETTRAWYDSIEPWDCECDDCQHFLRLTAQGMLPEPVTDTLQLLGIAPEKVTYLCLIVGQGDKALYEFCYRLAGKILEREDNDVRLDWGQGCCGHHSYPHGAPDFPEPYFDLIFFANLPGA